MKNLIFLLCLTLISFSVDAQTAAQSARSAALRHSISTGIKPAIESSLNYTDEVRKEVGGVWSYNAVHEDDTVLLATFPGDTTLTADVSLFRIEVIMNITLTDSAVTAGKINLSVDGGTTEFLIDSLGIGSAHFIGYVFRDNATDYFVQWHYSLVSDEAGDDTEVESFSYLTSFSKLGAIQLRYWTVDVEVADFQIFTSVQRLKN